MDTLEQITRSYFEALEQGAKGADLARFYDPEVIQEEFPNRLVPNGAKRDLAGILQGAERGQQVITGHRYRILSLISAGERVAVEFLWEGTLVIPLGTLPAGSVMRGRFASWIDFREGKILSQRSYDCFEPW